MKSLLKLTLLFSLILIFTDCRKDNDVVTEVEIIPLSENMNVSFLVVITDEEKKPLEDVEIKMSGIINAYVTDANGVVKVTGVNLPRSGLNATISKDGFQEQYKLLSGLSNTNNRLNVTLVKVGVTVINTNENGLVDGGGTLGLPETLSYADGSVYTGAVKVKSKYLDPDNADYLRAAPGNLLALNTDSEYRQLASLGMYLIELYDENDVALSIPEGSTARLEFPIADVHQSLNITEIPLWHFDDVLGTWIEEGKAIVEGNKMIAEVSHFTWWNCDLAYDFTDICIQFYTRDDFELSGVDMVFSVNGISFGEATTNNLGQIFANVPVGEVVNITYYINGEIVGSQDIGPFSEDDDKVTVILTNLVTAYNGLALNCAMAPIQNGYGLLKRNGASYIFQISNGQFSGVLLVGGEYEMVIYNIDDGKVYTQEIFIDVNLQLQNLGSHTVCDENIASGISGTVRIDTNDDDVVDVPVENASVSVFNVDLSQDFETVTDADGNYSVAVPPGIYRVSVFGYQGYNIGAMDSQPDVDSRDLSRRNNVITLELATDMMDEGNDFDIIMDKGRVGSLSGVVTRDTDGDGLGDEAVEGIELDLLGGFPFSVITDENGYYEINNIPEGTDGSIVYLQNVPLTSSYDESPDPEGDTRAFDPAGFIPFYIDGEENDTDNNFVLGPSGNISGYVTWDTDDDGLGDYLPFGVQVILAQQVSPFQSFSTYTNESGQYRFEGIEPSEYTLAIQNFGHAWLSDYDTNDDGDGDDSNAGPNGIIPVTLTEREDDLGNVFTLKANPVGGVAAGFVLEDIDNDGIGDIAVEGATIIRINVSGQGETLTTDQNGYFGIFLEDSGQVLFEVYAFGYTPVAIYDLHEDNDPAWPQPDIMVVDIPDNEWEWDGGNVFVVRKN